MSLHPSAHGFEGAADDYERGRPDYPIAAVELLTSWLGVCRGSTVVDVAAGTGKLTRSLVATGATVVAVEPVAGMRTVLAELVPEAEVRDGTAESLPLDDASADAATVAQAFHWFDGPAALAELHRVLRPGGGLGLVWNRRDLGQPLQAGIERIVRPWRSDTPSHADGAWRQAFTATDAFTELEDHRIPFEQQLDAAGLEARVLSTSFMAKLTGDRRERVRDDVRRLVEEHGEPLRLAYVAEVHLCRTR